MATINKAKSIHTAEGAPAKRINAEQQLRRSVMACLLWEKTAYSDGNSVPELIAELIPKVSPEFASSLAIEAREKMKLRHVPLLIVREMARHKSHKPMVRETLARVIQRPDEIAEFLAIYWKDGRCSIAASIKKGLAEAFKKFNEYQLAKYNRDGAVKLRDALFMVHAKPENATQKRLWKRLVNGELKTPDTWEVALSAGENKKDAWTRLIKDGGLGALAVLRNLRNMIDVGVDKKHIKSAILSMDTSRVLPYRFIAAARYAPDFEQELESAMFKSVDGMEKLPGETVLAVDVSGSMDYTLSAKSEMTRMDAACGLAVILREICESVKIITFSEQVAIVPNRRGFALRDAIVNSQEHAGTDTRQAVCAANAVKNDRLIVITDEQSATPVPNPKSTGWMINISTESNGVGYGAWNHIDGFSESVVSFIRESEKLD